MSLFHPLHHLVVFVSFVGIPFEIGNYRRQCIRESLSIVILARRISCEMYTTLSLPSPTYAPAKWTIDPFHYYRKNGIFHRVIPQKSTTKPNDSVRLNLLRIDSPDLEQQSAHSECARVEQNKNYNIPSNKIIRHTFDLHESGKWKNIHTLRATEILYCISTPNGRKHILFHPFPSTSTSFENINENESTRFIRIQ